MKKVIAILLVLLAAAGGIGAKVFIIGSPAKESSYTVRVEEGEGQISIYIALSDSAKAISNVKLEYKNNIPHLTPYTVLVSPFHDNGEYCLYYEILDETEFWIGNRLVWSK